MTRCCYTIESGSVRVQTEALALEGRRFTALHNSR